MRSYHRLGLICLIVSLAHVCAAAEGEDPYALLAREGREAIVRGDDGAAIQILETAFALEPTRVEVALYLIQLYRKVGRNTDAVDLSRQVLEYHPENVATLYLLGATYARLHDAPAAVAALEEACRVDTNHADAHLLLGQECVTLGEFDKAITVLTRAKEWWADSDLLHLYLGQAYLGTQRLLEAERSLRAATRLAPFEPRGYFHMGRLYRALGDGEQSRAMMVRFQALQIQAQEAERLSRVAQRTPDDPNGWFLLADHYMRAGRLPEALPPLSHAIEVAPGNASYRDMRAQVALRLGFAERAKADAIAAIRADPTQGAYYNTLGACAMQDAQPAMAAEAFRQAIRVGGDTPAFHLNLSRALEALGDVDGASHHRRMAGEPE
jgi:tetratricopeptide (TPR) repeat protein